ncbi:hypothetical protein WG899_17680 [Paucibacter sp. AS339]|uniref:hypothetical protein n=1 Tax=Paucibacter hankyongi TaxID=3133434 RepID=UPI0030A70168
MSIKSRLLKRLDADIAAASALTHQAVLKVKRALLIARHGQMSKAREQLTALHLQSFQHPHPELGAWLHFAEGLMSYYTDFSSAAKEKISHARLMASGAGLAELDALCSAWLAQLAYVRHEPEAMLSHALACDQIALANDHGARYRLCTVMGLAHDFAAQHELARGWYAKARAHAQAEGDDASVSALMYNMAEMRAAQLRREAVWSDSTGQGQGLLLGADSITHYDAAVGGSVKPDLTPVLRAQILVVEGEFAQALALYEAHLPQTVSAGLARLGSSLLADMAWCRSKLGQTEPALLQAQEAELELQEQCDVDDRAISHSRLAQVYHLLGHADKADQHATQAQALWQQFRAEQAQWAQALQQAALRPV